MLDILRPYKYALDALVVLALVGLVSWAVHAYNAHQQGIGEDRVHAQWDAAEKIAKDAQRARELQYEKDKDDALAQVAQSRQIATAAAATAASSGKLLGNAIQAISASSGSASVDALRANITALTAVLPQCIAEYREMASLADQHYQDSLMYQRAWPKNPPIPQPTKEQSK